MTLPGNKKIICINGYSIDILVNKKYVRRLLSIYGREYINGDL
jgi:hypothetical protein